MSDLVPEAEAKPSTSDLHSQVPGVIRDSAYRAYLDAANAGSLRFGDGIHAAITRAYAAGVAAGRAQAATDIRSEMTRSPIGKPLTVELAATLVEYCAQLAEGGEPPVDVVADGAVAAEEIRALRGVNELLTQRIESIVGTIEQQREIIRVLWGFYDTWMNKVDCYDPGEKVVVDDVELTGIASLLGREGAFAMNEAEDTVQPLEERIRALLEGGDDRG